MRAVRIDINWHSGLSIYASEQYLRSVAGEYGWLGGVDQCGALRCILPYTIVRKVAVRMVRFRVETIPLQDAFTVDEERAFLNDVVVYFRSVGMDIIIPGTTNAIFRTYPDGAIAAPYGTHIVDLTLPEEALWANVHSKHRNVIRNATKKGVQISTGLQFVEASYTLVRDTFKRSALPFMGRESFVRMAVGLGENVRVFVATHEDKVQACAVVPFSCHSAYYVYGGTTHEPLTGAGNLLQWEAIRQFRALGVKRYDFCGARINPEAGSKQAGLIMFKERFGSQMAHGYMWKYRLSPFKSAIYSLAVRCLRGGDIVDSEHYKLASTNASPVSSVTQSGPVVSLHGGIIAGEVTPKPSAESSVHS